MSAETKVVKGGFRATLALIISIVALILAIVAFNQMSKVRDETAKALEKVGIGIKKEEKKD
jgi:hypothetical protein